MPKLRPLRISSRSRRPKRSRSSTLRPGMACSASRSRSVMCAPKLSPSCSSSCPMPIVSRLRSRPDSASRCWPARRAATRTRLRSCDSGSKALGSAMSQRTLRQRLRRSCWPRNKCDVPKTTTAGAAAGRCRSSCVRTVYRLPPRVSAMHAPPGRDLFCVCPDPGRSLGAFCCAGVITLGGLNIQHTTSLLKLPPHRAIPSRGSAAVTRVQPGCYGSNRTEGCTTACEALGLVRPQREWTPFGPWILGCVKTSSTRRQPV